MSIEVQSLSYSYGDRRVLQDISFKVGEGEFLSILGPNGVGKSTLFRCMLGLLSDYTGKVLINGQDAGSLSIQERARQISYIPQSSASAFNYSVLEVVLMGVSSRLGAFASPRKEDVERCQWALAKTGIPHLAQRCFHKLSGGERQLVLIARALAQKARVLMLDEPTASLDFGNQYLVMKQARSLASEGYTVIQTTHNPEQSFIFSDRILMLQNGRVLKEGPPSEVLTKELIKELYGVDTDVLSLYDDRARVCIPHEILT